MGAYASPAMRIASQYRTASADAKEGEEGSLAAFHGNVAARYGHPHFDFKAAPSLFMDEDLRQEDFSLAHRSVVRDGLAGAEVAEASAVAARRDAEANASMLSAQERNAARYAAETREVERAAVAQRAELQHKYEDAEQAAMAARARADELRASHQLPRSRLAHKPSTHQPPLQTRTPQHALVKANSAPFSAALLTTTATPSALLLRARDTEAQMMSSLLGGRGGYIMDGSSSMQVRARCGIRTR